MSDWIPVLTCMSTRADLERAIDEYVRGATADVRDQLEADPDVSADERIARLSHAASLIRAKTRETFEAAWIRLRAELHDADGTTVH